MEAMKDEAPATKRDLAELETRLSERITNLDNCVSERIADVETRLSERITNLDNRLSERIADVEIRLSERITSAETNILKAIFNLAESFDKRTTAIEKGHSMLVERLAVIETRLLEVEKKLHLHPPAA
jgi:hypothetical protein